MKTNQLDLFSPSEMPTATVSRAPVLLMDAKALKKWKKQISIHQQQVRTKEPVVQVALFEVSSPHVDPDTIDPFELEPCSLSFYRVPADSPGQACIYFVIDMAADLLLYVGETCKSNHRWKGEQRDFVKTSAIVKPIHRNKEIKTTLNIV
ncbi:MAG: GIY-YIG nuclease family protein [Rivularia sp. ALOHA_DT_140]|nr:GIY-YIG nuclease family protein [Rivularia sp. ALOHA_DT_140]